MYYNILYTLYILPRHYKKGERIGYISQTDPVIVQYTRTYTKYIERSGSSSFPVRNNNYRKRKRRIYYTYIL